LRRLSLISISMASIVRPSFPPPCTSLTSYSAPPSPPFVGLFRLQQLLRFFSRRGGTSGYGELFFFLPSLGRFFSPFVSSLLAFSYTANEVFPFSYGGDFPGESPFSFHCKLLNPPPINSRFVPCIGFPALWGPHPSRSLKVCRVSSSWRPGPSSKSSIFPWGMLLLSLFGGGAPRQERLARSTSSPA